MSDYESLIWELDGHVATVTLNRPEKKNAMSWTMFHEIKEVFDRAGSDEDVRCLVLTGAGGAFCTGADLTDPANQVTSPIEMKARMAIVHEITRSVHGCSVPTISKVTGIAAGAGCNLALGMDLIVASTDASFAELFVKRGLVVDFGGSWILTRLLPLHRAKELALLGDTISAHEANELGLLNRLCEPEEVDDVTADLAGRIAAMPPRTASLIKENLNHAADLAFEQVLDIESLTQSLVLASEDPRGSDRVGAEA